MVLAHLILWFLLRRLRNKYPHSLAGTVASFELAGAAPLHLQVHARPRPRPRSARGSRPGRLVATLVATPDPGPPGPLRHAGSAGGGAAVPRRHRLRVRLPAAGRDGPRAGGREARRGVRAAARAPAAAGAPGTADAHRPGHLQQGGGSGGIRRPRGIDGHPVPGAAGAHLDRRAPPDQGELRRAQRLEPPAARGGRSAARRRNREHLQPGA